MKDDEDGVWRTICGRRVFIKNGWDLHEALRQSGKFEISKKDNKTYTKDPETGLLYRKTTADEFCQKLEEAKLSHDEVESWRVDSQTVENLSNVEKLYVTENGSTFAIKDDGDIIGVCAKFNEDHGSNIMKLAKKLGGNKLDCFDGIYGFYVKCGFEPVSYIPFPYEQKEYWPKGWKDNEKFRKENIIFFKTAKEGATIKTKKEFIDSVDSSSDYEDAEKDRDNSMKGD